MLFLFLDGAQSKLLAMWDAVPQHDGAELSSRDSVWTVRRRYVDGERRVLLSRVPTNVPYKIQHGASRENLGVQESKTWKDVQILQERIFQKLESKYA